VSGRSGQGLVPSEFVDANSDEPAAAAPAAAPAAAAPAAAPAAAANPGPS